MFGSAPKVRVVVVVGWAALARVAEALGWSAVMRVGGVMGSLGGAHGAGVVMRWPAVMGLWMMGWAAVMRVLLGFRAGSRRWG